MNMERAIAAVAIVVAGAIASALVWRALVRILFIREYEAGLLYRGGRFGRRLGPGARVVFPFWEEVVVVDLRKRIATIPGQEVLSADNVGLKVSVAAEYEVADPVRAVHETQSYEEALHVAIQLALRAAVGAAKIDDLLAQRIEIGKRLAEAVAPQVETLGLRLHLVEVKDVMFPGELKKIFAEVVRAQKEGQAALERARGETAALRSLANAARLVDASPALLSLRVLQSVGSASAGGGTIVLGVPQGLVPVSRKGTPRGGEPPP
jgi:regulator of protease activity HflC (stomatin/prohibitin superfamily)